MDAHSEVNICVMPSCCPQSLNRKAGSLDVEYLWPVTQRWPEEVMSGKNVQRPVQTERHVSQASLLLPGISYHVSLMSVQAAENKL